MQIQLTSNRKVGPSLLPYVIAEIGSNHNGDMDLARQLIDSAKRAGADCVKFQSFTKDTIFSKKTYEENYFLADDYRNRDDYTLEEIVETFAVSEQQLLEMRDYASEVGIDFASTPFSKHEADFLVDTLDADFIKIASMDANNYPFLEYVAKKGKPIVLSTGLCTLSEIDKAIQVIEEAGNTEIVILHCVAIYPPEDEQVNLKAMDSYRTLYPYPVGFSDHSLGTAIPLASIALGACLVEKHYTLDKEMFGWDHKVSADESDMKVIVEDGQRIFTALGNSRIRAPESPERMRAFRRSIVAAKKITKGAVITEDMIDYKRPADGLAPQYHEFVVGKQANRDIEYDEIINLEDF